MVTFPYNSRLITKVETTTDHSSIQKRKMGVFPVLAILYKN